MRHRNCIHKNKVNFFLNPYSEAQALAAWPCSTALAAWPCPTALAAWPKPIQNHLRALLRPNQHKNTKQLSRGLSSSPTHCKTVTIQRRAMQIDNAIQLFHVISVCPSGHCDDDRESAGVLAVLLASHATRDYITCN